MNQKEWVRAFPAEEGYYWCINEDDSPSVYEIMLLPDGFPMIYAIGTDKICDKKKFAHAIWYGPLEVPPRYHSEVPEISEPPVMSVKKQKQVIRVLIELAETLFQKDKDGRYFSSVSTEMFELAKKVNQAMENVDMSRL